MWRKWVPWRFIVRKLAQKQGFMDPIALLAKVQRFAQPAEVLAPIELLRLAIVLQVRGLINAQAIQHNLDWVWPYWVVRQFNPRDTSFIPRAFSLTHINLTHRNWTAVGVPDLASYPIVDPRGLVTPFFDGWSLDAWFVGAEKSLVPSQQAVVSQKWELEGNLSLQTVAAEETMRLMSRVRVEIREGHPVCLLNVEGSSAEQGWLVISLRPYNPEGVSEVEHVSLQDHGLTWKINKKQQVCFRDLPDGHFFSEYHEGDVYRKLKGLPSTAESTPLAGFEKKCAAGMVTAAAVFKIPAGGVREIEVRVPLTEEHASGLKSKGPSGRSEEAEAQWNRELEGYCRFRAEDKKAQFLYDAAVRSLVLHTPGKEAYPGPYTYKQFWFRDASFILQGLLAANLKARAGKILNSFPQRQMHTGFFRSHDGEWDSNGQVLWILRRFCELTGTPPEPHWKPAILKAAQWIQNKRLSEKLEAPHAGLFPAGFSAEHLGPNDYYYWDDFWGVEGLQSAAHLLLHFGAAEEARHYYKKSEEFLVCIESSLARVAKRLQTQAMPSSPYRRLDTACIGSLGAGYPLTFWTANDPRIIQTADYLLKNHMINGGFFHDMSHSGINPYLTLSIAQVLLRNQDSRYADLIRSIQHLATPTGQWPEAVHPQTLGGCMGDGHHVWASAEWVMMVRNCFVREEDEKLVLCSGILPEWLGEKGEASFGKTPTPYGDIEVQAVKQGASVKVTWKGDWNHDAPVIEIRLPGTRPVTAQNGDLSVTLTQEEQRV